MAEARKTCCAACARCLTMAIWIVPLRRGSAYRRTVRGRSSTASARKVREHCGSTGDFIDIGVDWTEKNKRAGAIFIEHTLEVADFMTGLELACRTRGDVELMREHDILALAPEETRTAREPLRWKVDKPVMGRRETFSVVPDGLFGLVFPDETAAYFVLEVDRGTIPLLRTDVPGTRSGAKAFPTNSPPIGKVGRHSNM